MPDRVEPKVSEAYDASSITFRVLRSYGWGPMLNLGWFPFRRPFTLLNLVLTPLAFVPRLRLPAAQLKLVRKAIRTMKVEPTSAVLDVACGRGTSSFVIANELPGTQVTAVDLLPENIAGARTLYGNAPNLAYDQGDALHLEYPDASFDRVLCLEAAFHFPDRDRFLSELARVVRPGGRVLIVDFMARAADDSPVWYSQEADLVRHTWQFEAFESEARYRANAEANGFRVDACRDWSAHVTMPIQSLFNLVAWLGRRRWGRRVMTIQNPMLRALTTDDWREFDRAARAHKVMRANSRYMALVLTR